MITNVIKYGSLEIKQIINFIQMISVYTETSVFYCTNNFWMLLSL